MPNSISIQKNEIREASDAQLEDRLLLRLQELRNLRFETVTQQPKNSKRIRMVRKEIARIKTEMRERQLQREMVD